MIDSQTTHTHSICPAQKPAKEKNLERISSKRVSPDTHQHRLLLGRHILCGLGRATDAVTDQGDYSLPVFKTRNNKNPASRAAQIIVKTEALSQSSQHPIMQRQWLVAYTIFLLREKRRVDQASAKPNSAHIASSPRMVCYFPLVSFA